MNLQFAELNALSNYSFLQGASHPEELVQTALEQGYCGLALTDECSLAGVVKAWKMARQYPHFRLVVGSEFRHLLGRFILLAPDMAAYSAISRLITQCQGRAEKGQYQFTPRDLTQAAQHCLLLWEPDFSIPDDQLRQQAEHLAEWFPQRIWLILIQVLDACDAARKQHILQSAQDWNIPVVASSRPYMHAPERKPLRDCLVAIKRRKSVLQCREWLEPNAENHLRSLSQLAELYPMQTLENTLEVLSRCTFDLSEVSYRYPREVVPKGQTASAWLATLTWQGALKRYQCRNQNELPGKVVRQIRHELRLINELTYEYYFLTVYDIVAYARDQGILCQGRGSAANSVVCYCLGITAVDPMRVSLLFERFVSRRRNEPPDIDVDFENSRREEVIQYLYRKYGRDRCALAATVVSYRPKSALRDLGRALGINLAQLENVIANYGWRYRGRDWIEEVISAELSDNSHILSRYKALLRILVGFPRHLSQHVGGFVITEGRLTDLVPVENAAMAERTVIQWDKDDLEAVGLMKVDILALGMLSAIQKSLQYVSVRRQQPFQMTDIPQEDDPAVFKMLQQADSVGLFQVESRAQMNMLPRLKPETYYDLVVQVAIVRPGPIHGDMVHPYLRRKHGEETVDVPLPELEPILGRTYGVPIFQEQVIAMAMVGAGFSADEAEDLRRSMSSWKQEGHMHKLRRKMTDSLLARGVSQEYADRICRQIEGFGEYGFPESHAASFALIVYVSAWLKHYYPAEFCCGLLNSQPMGFYQPWQLIQDAQRHDVAVRPVDINQSHWDHKAHQGTLRLGLRTIKGLDEQQARLILDWRPETGFTSFEAVTAIPGIHRQTLEHLASANAFACFGTHRYASRWQASGQHFFTHLFIGENDEQGHHALEAPDRVSDLLESYSSTRVILADHPMGSLRDEGCLDHCITAEKLPFMPHEAEIYVAGLVINRQRPKTSAGVTFVTLEDETGSINLVIWLQTALKQMETLVKSRILKVYGKVDRDRNTQVIHVVAYRLFDLSGLLNELENPSRDFH